VRKFGRKTLLTAGATLACLSHAAVGLSLHFGWAPGVLLFLLTFNMGYQPSFGTLAYVYNSEICMDKAATINSSFL
jgi:hypothetical protein